MPARYQADARPITRPPEPMPAGYQAAGSRPFTAKTVPSGALP